ncbi:MAG: isoaspartyl peptidase/L-asparaginase family protein [Rubricoccaceae bacterium]
MLVAVHRGRQLLSRGASALDVVVEVAAILEGDPTFDAGRGSVLDRDGLPQLDAGVMDGSSLEWGAVAQVRELANPIRVARELLDHSGQARLLVGEGAHRFAAEHGIPAIRPSALIVERETARYERLLAESEADAPRGTIGCVALDQEGRLAAATSTGGSPLARAGRVGDAPIVGAGFFADGAAAASSTGWGESILTVQLAARTCASVGAGFDPGESAQRELDVMESRVRWRNGMASTGGIIVLGADGRGGWGFTTSRMARGGWAHGHDAWSAVDSEPET